MSRDDTILVIRTLNPKHREGGPTYLYRVVWAPAAENFLDFEWVKEYVPVTPATTSRSEALTIAHNKDRHIHSEYGVREMSHHHEY